MATFGGLIGSAGGLLGTGVKGPGYIGTGQPVTGAQVSDAYTANQDALKNQNSLLTALQGQQGLQSQTDVYKQLQDIAAGRGPNPALAMLNNQAGKNQAAQSAAQASQRGSSANAGLIARQASQAGSNIQQDTAGQAAQLQAQQSLGAVGQAGNLATTMAGQQIGQTNANTAAQQAEQSNLLNAMTGYNSNLASQQGSVNAANAGLANTQLQGQQGLLGGIMGAFSGAGKSMMGAEGGEVGDDAITTPQQSDEFGSFKPGATPGASPSEASPSFASDAGATALGNIGGSSSGGGGGGGGGGMSSLIGMVAMMADGGAVQNNPAVPKSAFGKFLTGTVNAGGDSANKSDLPNFGNPGANALAKGAQSMASGFMPSGSSSAPAAMPGGSQKLKPNPMAEGGKVPALVSPGEVYLDPKDVKKVKKGADPIKAGEKIPGKPKHPGNDYRNDVVPRKLDEGGIVIPNAILQGPNPHWNAMRFVHQTMKKSKKK